MTNTEKTVFLDLYARNAAVRVTVRQYDSGRQLRVILRSDGRPCTPAASDIIAVTHTRPDGQTSSYMCTLQADGSVMAPIPLWATQLPGTGFGCITVIGANNTRVTTLDLLLQIEESSPLFTNDILTGDSTNTNVLTGLISQCSTIKANWEAALAQLDDAECGGMSSEASTALLTWMGTVNNLLSALSQAIAGIKQATVVYGIPQGGTASDIVDLSGVTAPVTTAAVTQKEAFAALLESDDSGTDDPGTDDPGTDDPGTDDPGTDDPGTDDPGTDDPGTDDPGTDDPGTDDPGTEDHPASEEYWTITYVHNGLLDTANLPTQVVRGQSVTIAPQCISEAAVDVLTKADSAFAAACWSGDSQMYVCMRRVVGEWSYKVGNGSVTTVTPTYTEQTYTVNTLSGTYTTADAHPVEQASSVTITPDGNVTVWVAPMVNLFGPTYASGQTGNEIALTANRYGSSQLTYWCPALSSGSISLYHPATDSTTKARLVTVDAENKVTGEAELSRLNEAYTTLLTFSGYTKATWRFGSAGSGATMVDQFLAHIGSTHFIATGV